MAAKKKSTPAPQTQQIIVGGQTITIPAQKTPAPTPAPVQIPPAVAAALGIPVAGVAQTVAPAPTPAPKETPAPKVQPTAQEQMASVAKAVSEQVQQASFNVQKEVDRAIASTIGPVNAVPSMGGLPMGNINAQAAGAAAMETLDIQAAAELADAFSSNQVGTTPVGKTIPPAPVTPVMPAPAPSAPPAPGATTPTTPAKPSMTDEQRAARIKASDRLAAQVNAWGFPQIADWLNTKIMAGETEEAVFVQMYDQPEYKTRFPGMEALRKKGKAITEDAYMKIEDAYTQTARFFDLPAGFYDTADDFGNLIANQVSAKEYQDRLQAAQDVAKSADPAIRQALTDLYQVSEGGITAYFANPDRALPIIQKQAKAAQIRGIAKTARFSDIATAGAAALEQLAGREAYAKLTEAQLAQGFTQADILRQTQQRLAAIEGTTFTEQQALSAVIEQNQQELLASQKRAQREQARFGGTSGVTATSLQGPTTI